MSIERHSRFMPIVKIKLNLVCTSDEAKSLTERLQRLVRSDLRIPVAIADQTDPIRGYYEPTVGYPPATEYSIEMTASHPSQIDEVTDLIMEFGTPLQKDKREVANLLSRVAREANTEVGFPISATDTMKALKTALGIGRSPWHRLVIEKLAAWFGANDG